MNHTQKASFAHGPVAEDENLNCRMGGRLGVLSVFCMWEGFVDSNNTVFSKDFPSQHIYKYLIKYSIDTMLM